MIRSLRGFRLTKLRLLVVAACSTLATVAVVTAGTGRTTAQDEALALLAQPPLIRRVAPQTPAPAPPAVIASNPLLVGGHRARAAPRPRTPSTPAASAGASTPAPPRPAPRTKTVKTAGHVFVIALSTPSYRAAFGHRSVARYLNATLRNKGTLLAGYHSLGGSELPDYLAMVSGQAPNRDTRANCPSFDDFGAGAKPSRSGILKGPGCVYPNTVTTIGDQVTAAGSQWRAYIPDIGQQSCPHPNSGAPDNSLLPFAGPQYDTRHNPFIYFHSLLDLGGCSADDVSLNELPRDLRKAARTPRYSFIAPPLCDDSSASTCPSGRPGGLAGEDAFLRQWVPRILASRAYRRNGVLMIVFAPSAPAGAASPSGPATPVRTGALILSSYARPGRTVAAGYDPYSVLRSTEDLLKLAPLAHAAGARSFVKHALPGL